MSQQIINIGTSPNNGLGDPVRTAFRKINENFTELYQNTINPIANTLFVLADAEYTPGTVVVFGGEQEITMATQDHDVAVAGVVSTRPAYAMNSGLIGDHVATVALIGRVPCRVQGPVRKGALMVSAGNGCARAEINPAPGATIGKALQSFDGDYGTIEIVVGRI
jgi:hypothetical protein